MQVVAIRPVFRRENSSGASTTPGAAAPMPASSTLCVAQFASSRARRTATAPSSTNRAVPGRACSSSAGSRYRETRDRTGSSMVRAISPRVPTEHACLKRTVKPPCVFPAAPHAPTARRCSGAISPPAIFVPRVRDASPRTGVSADGACGCAIRPPGKTRVRPEGSAPLPTRPIDRNSGSAFLKGTAAAPRDFRRWNGKPVDRAMHAVVLGCASRTQ
jgi:hypothetical protein